MEKSKNLALHKGMAVDALVFLSNVGFLIFLDPLLKTSSVLSAFLGGLMVATFFLYPIGMADTLRIIMAHAAVWK